MRIGVVPTSPWTVTGVNAAPAPWSRRPAATDYGTPDASSRQLLPRPHATYSDRPLLRDPSAGHQGERIALASRGPLRRAGHGYGPALRLRAERAALRAARRAQAGLDPRGRLGRPRGADRDRPHAGGEGAPGASAARGHRHRRHQLHPGLRPRRHQAAHPGAPRRSRSPRRRRAHAGRDQPAGGGRHLPRALHAVRPRHPAGRAGADGRDGGGDRRRRLRLAPGPGRPAPAAAGAARRRRRPLLLRHRAPRRADRPAGGAAWHPGGARLARPAGAPGPPSAHPGRPRCRGNRAAIRARAHHRPAGGLSREPGARPSRRDDLHRLRRAPARGLLDGDTLRHSATRDGMDRNSGGGRQHPDRPGGRDPRS